MLKRVGVLALLLSAAGAAFAPAPALAQDRYGYYGRERVAYRDSRRDCDRREHRAWVQHERQEQRVAESRDRERRGERRDYR
jgi:hypothetical protein